MPAIRTPNGKFAKGSTASPGRPIGSKNKVTVWAQSLIGAEKAIIAAIVADAKNGSAPAQAIAARYLAPPRRRGCELNLPRPNSPDAILQGLADILEAQSAGLIDEKDAASLIANYNAASQALQHVDLVERIKALEVRMNAQPDSP
jgi:hypothetical protein